MRECLLQIRGATTVLAFATQLAVLGVVAAVLLDSLMWVLVGPVGTIALMLGLAAFGPKRPKRKVTPSQFAGELENHLLGIDGEWEWDDTTSMAIADPKLDSLRDGLSKFDLLNLPEHREELNEIIVMLRRGEVPAVKRESTSVDSESGRSCEEGKGLCTLHLRLASEAVRRNRERKKIRNGIE